MCLQSFHFVVEILKAISDIKVLLSLGLVTDPLKSGGFQLFRKLILRALTQTNLSAFILGMVHMVKRQYGILSYIQ
jgi:hypothetical protein